MYSAISQGYSSVFPLVSAYLLCMDVDVTLARTATKCDTGASEGSEHKGFFYFSQLHERWFQSAVKKILVT